MIPDDEPWWMVRANTDNGLASERSMSGESTLADKVCQGPVPNDIAMAAEPASETERALDSLDFRPIGYEW